MAEATQQSRMNRLQISGIELVEGVKQLIEVDIVGGTVVLIAELAVVSEKAYGLQQLLTGGDCNLSAQSVDTHISLVVVVLLILAENTPRRAALIGFGHHLISLMLD